MTSAELRCFVRMPGVEIAAHSRHHVWLPAQPADVMREEVESSRSRLEALLGRSVYGFSYPYGAWDASCATRLVERSGVRLCRDDGAPVCDGAPDDRYALRRLAVEDSTGSVHRVSGSHLGRTCVRLPDAAALPVTERAGFHPARDIGAQPGIAAAPRPCSRRDSSGHPSAGTGGGTARVSQIPAADQGSQCAAQRGALSRAFARSRDRNPPDAC